MDVSITITEAGSGVSKKEKGLVRCMLCHLLINVQKYEKL